MSCFCAVQLFSGGGSRRIFLGYTCNGTTVDEINVLSQADPPSLAPSMPAVGDECTCDYEPCSSRLVKDEDPAKPKKPVSPGDVTFPHNFDVLGEWDVRKTPFPGEFLRLVLFGLKTRHLYMTIGAAYRFKTDCLDKGHIPSLDEDHVEYSWNLSKVWIGTQHGQQVGPFHVVSFDEDSRFVKKQPQPGQAPPGQAPAQAAPAQAPPAQAPPA